MLLGLLGMLLGLLGMLLGMLGMLLGLLLGMLRKSGRLKCYWNY